MGDEDRKTLSDRDLAGKRYVLYFYPKDDTPGCTTQACGIRDAWGELKELTEVFGVSCDSEKSHQKFIEKQELPFALLADLERQIVEAYGVYGEKQMYGKTYMGISRSTVIISPEGKVEAIFEKVKPKDHTEQLLQFLKESV